MAGIGSDQPSRGPGWPKVAALGADAIYPPQYLRARPEHWPGAVLTRHRPTSERS